MLSGMGRGESGKTRWRLLRLPLAVLGVSTLMAHGCLRQDELECERAVAQLEECCQGFAANQAIHCTYSEACGVVTEPDISVPYSQVILAESCDEIRSNGLCAGVDISSAPVGFCLGGAGGTPNTGCP